MDAPELGLRSEIERPLLASGEGADFHVRYAP
jgi:hypothetical protein